MTKTKLTNGTGVDITLKEGTAGILRKICDLQPGQCHHVTSELNQTYKEYWCIGNGSDQFTLSSDDLVGWKEIVIKPTSDPTKFHWEGIPCKKQGTPQSHFSFLSKVGNKVFGWMNGPKPSGPTVITITTDPATTTTTIKTPDSAKDTATCVAPTEGAPPAAATTTVTITSTTPSTATTPTATTAAATIPNISTA